jgi:hypothetical protein
MLCALAGGFCFTRHLSMPQGFSVRPVSIDGGWIAVRVRFLCCSLADVYKSHLEQFLNITVGTCVCCMFGRVLKCGSLWKEVVSVTAMKISLQRHKMRLVIITLVRQVLLKTGFLTWKKFDYDDKYLSIGFAWCSGLDCPLPLCLVCGKNLLTQEWSHQN